MSHFHKKPEVVVHEEIKIEVTKGRLPREVMSKLKEIVNKHEDGLASDVKKTLKKEYPTARVD